ncbi:MAG: hypothetical protein FWG20_01055 [Candidatus Cloacimonetes bacterium]|nr:hypothetical protein [Candidatus Cloacimonadota bacterium]
MWYTFEELAKVLNKTPEEVTDLIKSEDIESKLILNKNQRLQKVYFFDTSKSNAENMADKDSYQNNAQNTPKRKRRRITKQNDQSKKGKSYEEILALKKEKELISGFENWVERNGYILHVKPADILSVCSLLNIPLQVKDRNIFRCQSVKELQDKYEIFKNDSNYQFIFNTHHEYFLEIFLQYAIFISLDTTNTRSNHADLAKYKKKPRSRQKTWEEVIEAILISNGNIATMNMILQEVHLHRTSKSVNIRGIVYTTIFYSDKFTKISTNLFAITKYLKKIPPTKIEAYINKAKNSKKL